MIRRYRTGIKHNNKETGTGQLALFNVWVEYWDVGFSHHTNRLFARMVFARMLFTTRSAEDRAIIGGLIAFIPICWGLL